MRRVAGNNSGAWLKVVETAVFALLCGSVVQASDRLCQLPKDWEHFNAATDCRLERADFAKPLAAQRHVYPIKVVAHNIEHGASFQDLRGFYLADKQFSAPDVLLLSEVDRNCRRSGLRNIARDLARDLEMNFVYGIEFIILQDGPSGTFCEHGNAVLTRFPILNAQRIEHRSNDRRLDSSAQAGDGRVLGKRMFLRADLDVPGSALRVYSLHFSSGPRDNRRREAQAREVVSDSREWTGPTVAGGDINSGFYLLDLLSKTNLDPVPLVFQAAGFVDAHGNLPPESRPTAGPYAGAVLLLDAIFIRGLKVEESLVCSFEQCGRLSDHVPVLTRLIASGDPPTADPDSQGKGREKHLEELRQNSSLASSATVWSQRVAPSIRLVGETRSTGTGVTHQATPRQ